MKCLKCEAIMQCYVPEDSTDTFSTVSFKCPECGSVSTTVVDSEGKLIYLEWTNADHKPAVV